MSSYQITEATPEFVYCVVTRDNGETFGQLVQGEASKTEAGIEGAIREAIARVETQAKPREQKVLDAVQSRTVKELPTVEATAEETK